MIIGLDLDMVLVDNPSTRQALMELGREKERIVPTDWNYSNYDDELKKRIYELFNRPSYMNSLPPCPGVLDTLRAWKGAGHKLVVITARNPIVRTGTRFMVAALFPGCIDRVWFVGLGENKQYIMENERINIWVDDAPHGVASAAEIGIRTFLIRNEDTPYNHSVETSSKITAAESLSGVADILKAEGL